MSRTLRDVLKKHLETRGKNVGIADIMHATGKGQRSIERWIDGDADPDPANCYQAALACGCSEKEAREHADASKAKESA